MTHLALHKPEGTEQKPMASFEKKKISKITLRADVVFKISKIKEKSILAKTKRK